MTDKDFALCFKALGDETRLQIVKMLFNGPMCACRILDKFNITQPTLSYHMKMLCDSRLINVNKSGVWNHYSINVDTFNELSDKFCIKGKVIPTTGCFDNCKDF